MHRGQYHHHHPFSIGVSLLIELKNVSVEQDGKHLLRSINLVMKPGELTMVLGNSGSGLSVLLKTAAGLSMPSEGEIYCDDLDTLRMSEEEQRCLQTRTGFVFQDAALWANMPLANNLDLPLQAKFPDMGKTERRNMVAETMAKFGLSWDLTQRAVQFSRGQQKLLSFLRAIIPGPEALFLDDPMAGMDRTWSRMLLQELKELRQRKVTLVLSSHRPGPLFDLADRLVILDKGQIVTAGPTDEVRRSNDSKVREILADQNEVTT